MGQATIGFDCLASIPVLSELKPEALQAFSVRGCEFVSTLGEGALGAKIRELHPFAR